MAFNEYASLDGLALGRIVRERKVTPAELMDAAIARAEKHNAKPNAIVFKDYDHARAAALAYKAGAAPFAGVPLLLKDIMGDCAGMPTRSACAFVPATPMPGRLGSGSPLQARGLYSLRQCEIAMLLKHGIGEDEIGIAALCAAARRALGDSIMPWFWSYRVRMGVK